MTAKHKLRQTDEIGHYCAVRTYYAINSTSVGLEMLSINKILLMDIRISTTKAIKLKGEMRKNSVK